ncbi:undecaprenyldiphospho-muramoylpentapeptide beta-N-acetylglucosaminyltransferase [Halieaceae bacterium IMCC14734]|uniref:UDP-N-acetylglucosamine--N-acetylmuramyl-(pentapeptide) pyrophosphoryl-undecaprenol N-acetylglucosamine transferase n=2 Tax=Candidatus Litorirhabdus singularis TaxID=2518993 RepID=A0ABT3TJB4_9GAMM|nr:undecaprenyldiphospho-muramoylpentapeptide beta-N-acetylglucosaminyltransferase [Candidatus Litorirhabdus singularis]
MAPILIMAGGTGGHVFPALAVAEELRQRGYAVHWLGTHRGLEADVVPRAGFSLHFLPVQGLRGKGLLTRLGGLFMLLASMLRALLTVARLRPVCVLGMGGYVAGPGGIASWLLRRPLLVHEQNSVAGTTNRILARFSRRVLVAYPQAFPATVATTLVGNPVRAELLEQGRDCQYRYDGSSPLRLLVFGGSLGALALNEVLPQALACLTSPENFEVRHQTGRAHYASVLESYPPQLRDGVRVEAFIEDMAEALEWADLVLCRAGALTIAELTTMGRPSILVPLPGAIDDHQAHNAQWLADHDAALVVKQGAMQAATLAAQLEQLAAAPERLAAMAAAAAAVACREATHRVADICEEVRRV